MRRPLRPLNDLHLSLVSLRPTFARRFSLYADQVYLHSSKGAFDPKWRVQLHRTLWPAYADGSCTPMIRTFKGSSQDVFSIFDRLALYYKHNGVMQEKYRSPKSRHWCCRCD